MARTTTGTKYKSRGVWYATITIAERKRESFALPTCTTEEQAEVRKSIVNDVVQRLRTAKHAALVPRFAKEAAERPAGKELDRIVNAVTALCCGKMVPRDLLLDSATVREVGEMWTSGEMEKKYRGQVTTRKAANEIARLLEKHVYPHVGDLPVTMFGAEHGQLVLNNYPATHDPGSLRNIARLTSRILNLAVSPLNLLPSNPLPKGWIPKLGPKKARTCVYPNEDAQLMVCTQVPLGLRVLWGYLHREGHRKGEVLLLMWSDFDLNLGTINLDKNKTKQPRFWVLSPGVAAMLRAWKKYREEALGERLTGSDLVFFARGGRPPGIRVFHAARTYRENLQTAGVDRAQLFAHGGNRRQVRAHDTRAAFVTVALAAGRNEMWIADRTGHSSMAEMGTYRRNARAFAELNLGDWTPIDTLIAELMPYLPGALDKEPATPSSELATPSAASPSLGPASAVAASAPAPSHESARRTAAAEAAAHAVPVPVVDTAPCSVPGGGLEARAAVVEASLGAPVANASEVDSGLGDASLGLLVAVQGDAAPGGDEVQVPQAEAGGAGAAEGTAEEGARAASEDLRTASVGANVGAERGGRRGGGFVGVEIRRDLPWMMGVQFSPTLGVPISSSETGP